MTYRKKLIEVALPLEAINKASAREKSIRHGHPSTLHLWWARRPLAACRAVLFASLVDDPDSDPMFAGDEGIAASKRAELFNLIEELVQWENSNNPRVINRARAEIARCVAARKIESGEFGKDQKVAGRATANDLKHMLAGPEEVNAFLAEHAPPVLDPFCGGGSIPLEAQRLGLRAYASDLNPVAVLITKALIEIPPKFAGRPPVNPEWQRKSTNEKAARTWQGAQGLAEDVRYYGQWMRDEAEKRIGHLYPKVKITTAMAKDRPDLQEYVGDELTTIGWIWARSVACPNPACRLTIPLIKSLALCTKAARPRRLALKIDAVDNSVAFGIVSGLATLREGTISRKGAVCPRCSTTTPYEYIREEAKAGRMDDQLIVQICDGANKRLYLPASPQDIAAANAACPPWKPELQLAHNPFSLRPALYGLGSFADLFTSRQLHAMVTFASLVADVRALLRSTTDDEYANAVGIFLALSVSRLANRCSNACFWDPGGEKIQQVFARQAIAMAWDFVEANPIGNASGGFIGQVDYLANAVANSPDATVVGHVTQHDATKAHAIRSMHPVLATDPPYYDNIDYADLSDFFYVWLRHMLRDVDPCLFSTVATPKTEELVATPYRFGGDKARANQHFTDGIRHVFGHLAAGLSRNAPSSVIYGFKQQEESANDDGSGTRASTGWETFLESLCSAQLAISGTWPLRTELVGNLKGKMNALASSIVLVCRPRPDTARLATRKDFITALRRELPEALKNLQHGNIAPVDLAQASIGPGMAVFTRYAKVLETDGTPMTIRTALGLINQALDEVLAEQEGEFDGDTRWALAWFEQFGVDDGPFGVAETLSKAKNTAVNGLVEAGVVRARAGKVRLVRRDELNGEWDPATDRRLTVWECTQHLIRRQQQQGEQAAAALMHKLGGYAETARDLAYRLYHICERKKWADEALAYNGLVIAWPELTKLALAERSRAGTSQQEMF